MLHSSVISKKFEFVTASPSEIAGAFCRLSTSLRARDDIKGPTTEPKQAITRHSQEKLLIHPKKTVFPPACSLFYFESIFLHQKGSTIMTKLTYTLAIINGTVCYECQPSTPHAFYSGGGWFAPFCTVLELTRKNTVKA